MSKPSLGRVPGYVVNIITPTVIDIDIALSSKEQKLYHDVLTHEYIYQDAGQTPATGRAVRCKLRNISANCYDSPDGNSNSSSNSSTINSNSNGTRRDSKSDNL